MKLTPVKGTNDYLSQEMELRDFLKNKILNTYKSYGFERISTPILEDIENLDNSEGGENLNLIFKILQRGEKLEKVLKTKDYKNLSDIGLRYDLTLPLTRFYANNKSKIINPFKVIQIDRVYRAERPQKGRLREFMQCDIDIIGSSKIESEIELIAATAEALLNVGLKNFNVKINNRKILKTFIEKIGFNKNDVESICITFDKLDKIGADGVKKELLSKNLDINVIEKLISLSSVSTSLDEVEKVCGNMTEIQDLKKIIESIEKISKNRYKIEYDISLVRGQGYYTGSVFEIQSNDFNGAIAGGGRYDNLIEKFTGETVPAVGFSIGFERIVSILTEKKIKPDLSRKKIAIFYENNFMEGMKLADKLRKKYDISLYEKPKKLSRFLDKLLDLNYYGYLILGKGEDIKVLKKNDNFCK